MAKLLGTGRIKLESETGVLVGVTEADLRRWAAACPDVDVTAELRHAANWCLDVGSRGIKKNYAVFLMKWMKRAQTHADAAKRTDGPGRVRAEPGKYDGIDGAD